MKNLLLTIIFLFGSTYLFSQKKSTVKAVSTKTTASLAKIDNLVAEIKTGNFQISINENGKFKDAIIVKSVDSKFVPTDCKLTAFTASGVKLYLLTWTEKTTTKTDVKTEEITTIYSNIYEISSKKLALFNTQFTNHITEKVFLDRLKNASETQEKMRREGYEFKLNPDGSVTQKSKTQENKLIYDVAKMEYIVAKKK